MFVVLPRFQSSICIHQKSNHQLDDEREHKNYTAPVLDVFKNLFDNKDNFAVDEVTFKRFKAIVPKMWKFGKNNARVKNDLLDYFSAANWKEFNKSEQGRHSLFDC